MLMLMRIVSSSNSSNNLLIYFILIVRPSKLRILMLRKHENNVFISTRWHVSLLLETAAHLAARRSIIHLFYIYARQS